MLSTYTGGVYEVVALEIPNISTGTPYKKR